MKGAQDVLSLIIITGVLFGLVIAVWAGATPQVERSKEAGTLQRTEEFAKDLADAIKFVASNRGSARISMAGLDPRGSMRVDETEIIIVSDTMDSVYEKGVEIPIRSLGCAETQAEWGVGAADAICVVSQRMGERVRTTYTIRFIRLVSAARDYSIQLLPVTRASGTSKTYALVEHRGSEEELVNGKTAVSTLVAVTVV